MVVAVSDPTLSDFLIRKNTLEICVSSAFKSLHHFPNSKSSSHFQASSPVESIYQSGCCFR